MTKTILDQTIELFGYDPSKFLLQARIDGWGYYRHDMDATDPPSLWRIGRRSEPARFETDADAEEYVAARADAGDKRCIDALVILAALASLST